MPHLIGGGAIHYTTAASVVEAVTGRRKNILAEYKKIIATAREEQQRKNAQTIAEHPELAKFIGDLDKEGVLVFDHKGRQFVLATTLPRKKGTVDDIFVFQKVTPNQQQDT